MGDGMVAVVIAPDASADPSAISPGAPCGRVACVSEAAHISGRAEVDDVLSQEFDDALAEFPLLGPRLEEWKDGGRGRDIA
eukprot:gene29383-36303_t